jgi:hypothetical protein
MSKEKAKAFLEYLINNKELVDKYGDVSMNDLREAARELEAEGKLDKGSTPHWTI